MRWGNNLKSSRKQGLDSLCLKARAMPQINLEQITNTIQFVHAPSTALKIPPDVCLCHSTAFLCSPLIPHEMASIMNGNSAFYLLHERTGFTLLALANGWHEISSHSPLLCQAGSQGVSNAAVVQSTAEYVLL